LTPCQPIEVGNLKGSWARVEYKAFASLESCIYVVFTVYPAFRAQLITFSQVLIQPSVIVGGC
jgi:hypothetical protein